MTIGTGQKLGALPLLGGRAGSPSNTMSLRPRPTCISIGILIHPAVWPHRTWAKNWGEGELGPHPTQSPGPRPTSIQSGILIHPAIWPQQIWAENWGRCPFNGGGAGSPCNTVWPRPRPTGMRSFILIHPTLWPQCTNVSDRTGPVSYTHLTLPTILRV